MTAALYLMSEIMMDSGIDNLPFPMAIRDFISYLCLAYDLDKGAATSTTYTLLESGVLIEETFNLRLMETTVKLAAGASELSELIQQAIAINDVGSSFLEPIAPATPQAKYGVQLVATVPLALQLPYPAAIKKMKDVFAAIIQVAEQELYVSSPYIEQPGLNLLLEVFEQAAKRKVKLCLLTRIDKPDSPAMRQIMAILGLNQLFLAGMEVRSLSRTLTDRNNREYLSFGGVHAKLLIADKKMAYIGSGEIRDHALNHNFEMGVLVEAPESVDNVRRLFEAIWDVSDPVSMEYCMSFVK